MQNFNIVKKTTIKPTFRTESIKGKFDLHVEEIKEVFEGQIPVSFEDDWSIGVIVGASGTGKTTISKELIGDNIINGYDYFSSSICDDMPKNKTVDEIVKAFNAVGFSSPPSWLKPYSVLSNGQKMRVDLARAILSEKDFFAFDEYTSVVDRDVAKIGSLAIQKAIRKENKKFIAISCHYDIIEWLQPDWVFSTDDMTLSYPEKKNQKSSLIYTELKKKAFGKLLKNIIT